MLRPKVLGLTRIALPKARLSSLSRTLAFLFDDTQWLGLPVEVALHRES
jgi:hypothetical protein